MQKLKGQIESIMEHSIILDVQGIGYLVNLSGRTLSSLPEIGGFTTLYIEYLIRQEHPFLFGFLSSEDQSWFRLLLTVQGVGTRVALAILSAFSTQELMGIFSQQDKLLLTRAEGVGPKLASRLVSELKEKVINMAPAGSVSLSENLDSSSLSQAISALYHLGYKRQEAAGAVAQSTQSLGPNPPVDVVIKVALGILSPSK